MKQELYVTIPQGKLLGKEWISSFTGDTYYGFSGIPYAKTPVGEMRFQPPEPADGWEGVRDATNEGDDCMQFNLLSYTIEGTEDCLYTNVYTPEPPCKITTLKPVMIMIHWGGNAWGSGSSKLFGNVDYMMNTDIIVVTFNYRLHVFGFLNLGIPECSGNMGLKDQVMLFKWVQNNIKCFGGDPDNVTLFGCSSGASYANLHMMSPMSEGLFHKTVMQSGFGLSPIWSYQNSAFERAVELALVAGFTGLRTPKRLLEFYKQKSSKDLMKACGILRHMSKEKNEIRCETCLFLPSVEKVKEGAFMWKTPREMIVDMRPMPTLLSMNEKEGVLAFCADMFKIIPKKLGRSLKEHLWQYSVSPDTVTMITKKIRPYYFNKKDEPTVDEIINLYTDLWFCEWNNVIDFLATLPTNPPVYIYHFTFDGKYNFSKKFFAPIIPKNSAGAIHADDSSYLFAYSIFLEKTNGKIEYEEKESKIIRKMVSIVTTFMKTGNPNNEMISEVNWKPFHPESPSHLLFDEELSIVDTRINPERVAMWNDFLEYIKKNEPAAAVKTEKASVKISSNDVKAQNMMIPDNILHLMSAFKDLEPPTQYYFKKMKQELCVTIPQGKLVGKEWISSFTGDIYYGFSGVPYAKPPLGELRFMPPQPADNWQGVLQATTEGSDCRQFSFRDFDVVGSEDCLYANIYSSEPPCQITTLKPVMVVIHWGGNCWGSASAKVFGCVDFLMKTDMIIVTFNYRLHILGFLNLGIPECPGNMGLKDQVMLLKWVQNNIKYFGGDPGNVTLFASSSGASNVNLHMMSPMSRGLFHKAVLQSGFALSPMWSYQVSPFERAVELAKVMGYSGQRTPKKLLEFFKRKSTTEMIKGGGALRSLHKEKDIFRYEVCLFLPTVEKIQEGAFMTKTPREMMSDLMPIPTLWSVNEKEGLIAFCADILKHMSKKLGSCIKANLWQYEMSPETVAIASKKIRSFYFKNREAPTIEEITDLYSDMWFSEWYDMINILAKHPTNPPAYIYHFTYHGRYNFSKKWFSALIPEKYVTGAIHADDSSYLFAYKMWLEDSSGKIYYKEEESNVIKKMVSIITNFVKTGNPNCDSISEVHWKPYHPENPSHLLFDKKLSTIDDKINPERTALWAELIDYIKKNEPNGGKIIKTRINLSSYNGKENVTRVCNDQQRSDMSNQTHLY